MAKFTISPQGCNIIKLNSLIDNYDQILSLKFLFSDQIVFDINECITILSKNPIILHIDNFNPKIIYGELVSKKNLILRIQTTNNIFEENVYIDDNILINSDCISFFKNYNFKKPKLVSAYTHCYNDNMFLKTWTEYYGKLLGYDNVYVIDHGSTTDIKNNINPNVNIIKIPRGLCDHINISNYCSYFQRFLLTQYEWVIHNDCDEFLIFENDLVETLSNFSNEKFIFTPNTSFDIVQNNLKEKNINWEIPILNQREWMYNNPHYIKPSISNTEITWGPGFHRCFEKTKSLDSVLLIHLKFIDSLNFIKRNADIWNTINQTSTDEQNTPIKNTKLYTTLEINDFDTFIPNENQLLKIPYFIKNKF